MRINALTARLPGVREAWRDWWRTYGGSVVYVFKVWIACLLAAWISLKFELDQPRTSMTTVAIVMQARAGMVFAKGVYRMLGTLVGITASFLMVALFAQERVLFLTWMAVWIGVCTAGSMVLRNHQSYAFVLSGYTMCIVGLPATLTPGNTFDIGIMRISEIMTGLLCAMVVSDVVFPQRMWNVMRAAVRKRFADFCDMLRAAAQRPRKVSPSVLLRFLGDILNLESMRASTVLEGDDSRIQHLRLGLLNVEFMEVSTTFHALEQFMRRQRESGNAGIEAALLTLITPLVEALALQPGRSAQTEAEAAPLIERIQHYRKSFEQRCVEIEATLPPALDRHARLDFATGVELIERFAQELAAYTRTYVAIGHAQDAPATDARVTAKSSWSDMHFDALAVALAGLRGAIVLILMACLWIYTDWSSGVEAITLAVVTSTLFAATPSPSSVIKKFLAGTIFGGILSYVCTFVLMPGAQGFVGLALALTPPMVVLSWLTTRPSTAMFGLSAFLQLFMHIGFAANYNGEHVAFINATLADIFAVMIASAMYGLIDLTESSWARKRTARAMRTLVVEACHDTPIPLRSELEKAARDLIQRSGNTARTATREDKEVIDWMLATLEVGHVVLEMRKLLAEMRNANVKALVQTSLHRVADVFEEPSNQRLNAAVHATDNAIDALEQTHESSMFARDVMTHLHFMRSALLDTASALATQMPASEIQERPHAA